MNRSIAIVTVFLLITAAVCAGISAAETERIDSKAVRSEIRDILSNSEYNRDYNSPRFMEKLTKPILKLIEKIIEWIGDLLNVETKYANKTVSYILAGLVITAFLILVALVLRKLAGNAYITNDDERFDITDYELPSSRPLIKEAARLAESGDYRGAFRCAYLASISYLDEIKALRFERSRTNWEYLRELRQGGYEAPYSELHPLTLEFDRKFYGRESCSLDDYMNAVRTYERITTEAAA